MVRIFYESDVIINRYVIAFIQTFLFTDITELGNHLLDLPVEPHLGKMILYAVSLKCLDPVLTIVACLSYR